MDDKDDTLDLTETAHLYIDICAHCENQPKSAKLAETYRDAKIDTSYRLPVNTSMVQPNLQELQLFNILFFYFFNILLTRWLNKGLRYETVSSQTFRSQIWSALCKGLKSFCSSSSWLVLNWSACWPSTRWIQTWDLEQARLLFISLPSMAGCRHHHDHKEDEDGDYHGMGVVTEWEFRREIYNDLLNKFGAKADLMDMSGQVLLMTTFMIV